MPTPIRGASSVILRPIVLFYDCIKYSFFRAFFLSVGPTFIYQKKKNT